MKNPAPAVTLDGTTSLPAHIETATGFLRPLSRMNGSSNESYVLWHYDADQEFSVPESLTDYLQCAGTAERLMVELRQTRPDGSYSHWRLGRAPASPEATAPVEWGSHTTMVSPEEVWTAEQAAPLFEQYATERTIPDWVHRTPLDI